MRILGLDTSGKTASAAILDTESGILLGEHTVYTSRTHSQVILPLCKELLEECRLGMEDVDCLAAAVGPGSYTGLRIGIAVVQGMAMARNIPCTGVSTLEALAVRILGAEPVLAIMHARADLFYCAKFRDGERLTQDAMLTAEEIAGKLLEPSIRLTGDGGAELLRQLGEQRDGIKLVHPVLRLQSAAGVCMCAAGKTPGTAEELTASYLQAVQIQKKKQERS